MIINLIYNIFNLINIAIIGFMKVLFLPFIILSSILNIIYRSFFFVHIWLNSTCVSIFGNGFGCKILNPDYVFFYLLKNLIIISFLIYIALEIYNAYVLWSNKAKKNEN